MADSSDDAIASPTFTHFPRLAPELRAMIWRHSLPYMPEKEADVLYPYKKGCWKFGKPEPFDWAGDDTPAFYVQYDIDLLDPFEVCLPLLLVNRESNGIAKNWMQEKSLKSKIVAHSNDEDRHFAVRPSRLDGGVIYFTPQGLDDFLAEPDTMFVWTQKYDNYTIETWDYNEPYFLPDTEEIARVAISVAVFRERYALLLRHLVKWFPKARWLQLIINEESDGVDDAVQRGELRTLVGVPDGIGFYWDGKRLDAVDSTGNPVCMEDIPASLFSLFIMLGEIFHRNRVPCLNIQLMYAK